MKKLYSTPEHKQRQKRHLDRIEKKRKKRRPHHTSGSSVMESRTIQKQRRYVLSSIKAPRVFSLTDALDSALAFSDDLWSHTESNIINCDLSSVKELTPDAILYLISMLANFTKSHPQCKIRGVLPQDINARTMLIESRILDYVKRPMPSRYTNRNILIMKHGLKVDPEIAAEVVEFVESHLNLTESDIVPVYDAIIELMANTAQHAAEVKYTVHWWVITVYRPDQNSVHISFLDNGLGIPHTVNKKGFFEKVASATNLKI